jgi:hypothetical protein
MNDGVPEKEEAGMRVRKGLRMFVVVAAAAMVLGTGVGSAAAQQPIGPNQHFLGLVNGSNDDPTVYVVCPGPISNGRTGPVAGGQTMSVANVAIGGGYTGLFSVVYAWFVPTATPTPVASPTPVGPPTQLKFTEYGVPQSIPTSVRVPCDGTGEVEFSSCPYLAPCAFGWVPNYVKVNFIDLAV